MISGLWQQGEVKTRLQNQKKNRSRRRLRLWLLLALVVSAGLLTGFLYGADWRQHLAVPFYSISRQNHSFQESTGYHANPFMGAVAFAKNRSSV